MAQLLAHVRARLSSTTEKLSTTAPARTLARANKSLKATSRKWLLNRRRARVSKQRSTSKKSMYVLLASLLVLLFVFSQALEYLSADPVGKRLTIDQLSALATLERIDTAHFQDEDALVTGTFSAAKPDVTPDAEEQTEAEGKDTAKQDRSGSSKASTEAKGDADAAGSGSEADGSGEVPGEDATDIAPVGSGTFYTYYPNSDALTAMMVTMVVEAGAKTEVDPQFTKQAVRVISTFLLPLMILANLFALLFSASRGSGSAIGEVMMFGSMGKRRQKRGHAAPITFDQVAGADEAVAELREVRDYLEDPEKYEEIGAMPPKGVLLFGPPGCGKTLLAKAVAGEAGVPFFSVAGAEFVESLVGVGAARVRDLFQRVRAVAPAIVFIDELDAAGRKRGAGGSGGGSDEREQTLNQILVEMDGFEVSAGIVIIGATNRPDILDPALLRPGRFDRHVTVDQPDMNGRQAILELHATGKPMAPTVDFGYLARRSPGFSGADLANVINEAALLTVRETKPEIEMPELEEAIQRVLAGPKKRGRVLTPEERKRAAYHESGHGIVAAAAGRLNEVHRVSILARGRGLGSANIQQETDAVLLTRSQLIAQLVTCMGGVAAEELIFGEPSTGAEQDFEQATDLARDMIGRFGMGKRRRRLLSKESEGFLGDELGLSQISGQTHHEMEEEIDKLLEEAEQEAQRLLTQHNKVLDTLATRLEVEETLEGSDLEAILALVRPEVTFFGGLADGPIRHSEVDEKNPLGTI